MPHSEDSRTSAPGNSGTRNISWPKSLAGWPVRTPTTPSPIAALTGDSSGIWPFFMRHIPNGGRHRRLFSGTVRSSAWLLRSRRHSRTVHNGARSGVGVVDPAAEASLLLQFLDLGVARVRK